MTEKEFLAAFEKKINGNIWTWKPDDIDAIKVIVTKMQYVALLFELNDNRVGNRCIMDMLQDSEPYNTMDCPKNTDCFGCIHHFVFSSAFDKFIERVVKRVNVMLEKGAGHDCENNE